MVICAIEGEVPFSNQRYNVLFVQSLLTSLSLSRHFFDDATFDELDPLKKKKERMDRKDGIGMK